MSRKTVGLLWIVIVALAVGAFVHDVALSEDLAKTIVVNLQTPHPIKGQVAVEGPVTHSQTIRLEDLVVSPALRSEPTRWTEAGHIRTAGFTSMVLSLHGQVKDTVFRQGDIAVVLLPDEDPILQAFTEGEIHLPLELEATTDMQATYFSATQPALPIAFPAYRVFLYNTTDRSAAVNLAAYLVN